MHNKFNHQTMNYSNTWSPDNVLQHMVTRQCVTAHGRQDNVLQHMVTRPDNVLQHMVTRQCVTVHGHQTMCYSTWSPDKTMCYSTWSPDQTMCYSTWSPDQTMCYSTWSPDQTMCYSTWSPDNVLQHMVTRQCVTAHGHQTWHSSYNYHILHLPRASKIFVKIHTTVNYSETKKK